MQRSEFAPFVGKSLSHLEISQLAEVDGMIALIGKNPEGDLSAALAYMLDLLPIHQVNEFSWHLSKKEEFLDHCDRDEIFGSEGDAFKPGEEIFCLDGEITFEELSLDEAEEEEWDNLVEKSQPKLVAAAQEARRQSAEGQATPLDCNQL